MSKRKKQRDQHPPTKQPPPLSAAGGSKANNGGGFAQFWIYLDRLEKSVIAGSEPAAHSLLAVAQHAALALERMYLEKPALVATAFGKSPVFGVPVLRSFDGPAEVRKKERDAMVQELVSSAHSWPFITLKKSDPLSYQIINYWFVADTQRRLGELPLKPLPPLTRSSASVWAKAMAEQFWEDGRSRDLVDGQRGLGRKLKRRAQRLDSWRSGLSAKKILHGEAQDRLDKADADMRHSKPTVRDFVGDYQHLIASKLRRLLKR